MDPRGGRLLLLVFLVCALIQGAAAVNTILIEDVQDFEFNVSSPSQTIPQINLYGLREGVTVVNLDAYGDLYLLEIDCFRDGWFDAWWTWNVSLTYPNGTVATDHIRNLAPTASGYDMYIQYFIGDFTSIVDVNLFVDLRPLNVKYQTMGFLPESNRQFIAFSSVSATSPGSFNAKIFELTPDEFEKMKKGDLLFQLEETIMNVGKDFFAWSWSAILWFVEKIPVIGPYLSAILELSGAAIGEIVSWGLLLLENIEIVLMFAEGLILADALLSSRSLMGLLRRIVDNHVRAVKFSLWLLDVGIQLFTRMIDMIARIVQAIKPL